MKQTIFVMIGVFLISGDDAVPSLRHIVSRSELVAAAGPIHLETVQALAINESGQEEAPSDLGFGPGA